MKGDGKVTYYYFHSYWEDRAYQIDKRAMQLSVDATETFLQGLVDVGLFELQRIPSSGADFEGVWIRGEIDGYLVDIGVDSIALTEQNKWQKVLKHFEPLVENLRHESDPDWIFPATWQDWGIEDSF